MEELLTAVAPRLLADGNRAQDVEKLQAEPNISLASIGQRAAQHGLF
ncbi:hypothetical protein [Microbulbifer elongatus]|nr:hypothetical protein [Microbulbifer elongatus]